MLELPAHPEVPDALSRLRSAGFVLATLTNCSPEMAHAQLEHARILELFDHMLSVESARRYKPGSSRLTSRPADAVSGEHGNLAITVTSASRIPASPPSPSK
jgi:hypothetical protein